MCTPFTVQAIHDRQGLLPTNGGGLSASSSMVCSITYKTRSSRRKRYQVRCSIVALRFLKLQKNTILSSFADIFETVFITNNCYLRLFRLSQHSILILNPAGSSVSYCNLWHTIRNIQSLLLEDAVPASTSTQNDAIHMSAKTNFEDAI